MVDNFQHISILSNIWTSFITSTYHSENFSVKFCSIVKSSCDNIKQLLPVYLDVVTVVIITAFNPNHNVYPNLNYPNQRLVTS